MINNNDIKKLKEAFVTKKEFEGLLEIVATKDDLKNFATKDDVINFKNEILTQYDKILEKLDPIMTEKDISDEQGKRQQKVLEIHNNALKRGKILSDVEVLDINKLQAF